ncbi:hypothetical protein Adeg_0794 [Ammonifex degensii KC4]|uniref:TadE-like domain-containing protein n=1 Tax=Ammonifex degensii (strain DSM 10501 / KC4) TaxID=429009 RepID=C9RCF9_AMMDK|nr:hypothetical protein Adeg_0794 [Ammonifex degensii KC4]
MRGLGGVCGLLAERLKEKRGDFAVYALTFPLFLFLVFAGTVGVIAWNAKQVVTEAAREGVRLASVGASDAAVKQKVASVVVPHLLGAKKVPSSGEVGKSYDLRGLLVRDKGKLWVSGVEVRGASGSVQAKLQSLVGKEVGLTGQYKEEQLGKTPMAVVPGSPQQGGQGQKEVVGTGGRLCLRAYGHNVSLTSQAWSPPPGAKILRVHLKGNSERGWDWGYLQGWDGSKWVDLAKRSGAYDEWVAVPGGVTQIRTRLTTDRSVLWDPTYVDAPEVEVEVQGDRYGVEYPRSAQAPAGVRKGESFTVEVYAVNRCSFSWTPEGRVGMAYHWYDDKGKPVLWDGERDYVKTTVPPGGGYTFRVPVKAPDAPGKYTLVLDLVREGVTWFEQKGCPVLKAQVDVVDSFPRFFEATSAEEASNAKEFRTVEVTTFDPDRDVVISRVGDRVSVEVRYHVPSFFPVGRLLGKDVWGPEITVKGTASAYREPV